MVNTLVELNKNSEKSLCDFFDKLDLLENLLDISYSLFTWLFISANMMK